jgi:uracil-DNA glycosylase family 4
VYTLFYFGGSKSMTQKVQQKPTNCTDCALFEDPMLEGVKITAAPDIVFVGDFPKSFDMKKGAFRSSSDMLVRNMCSSLQKRLPRNQQPRLHFMYAVKCCPNSTKYKVYAETYNQCSGYLKTFLDRYTPKVIVSFGTEAMRSLDLKGTVTSMRGGIYPYRYSNGEVGSVIPTYATFQIKKQPGLTSVLEGDIKKAYSLVTETLTEDALDIRTPRTVEDILAQLEELKADAKTFSEHKGRPLPVAIDTETTSLLPYDPVQRMIAISISWKDNVGIAFPYEHRENPFTPEELATIRQAVEEALNSETVKLIMFNAKFDYQWLVLKSLFNIPAAEYDGMLAEHALDEDKKGNYSLKALTKDYFPQFGQYEEELKTELEKINLERREAANKIVTDLKEERKKILLDFWMALTQEQRLSKCAEWLTRGYTLGNYQDLIEVRRRKYKGELVVIKKYQAAVERMLKVITPADLGIDLPEIITPEVIKATFEDIDIGILLKYATYDAILTRKIAHKQVERFSREHQNTLAIEKMINSKLPTKPTMQAFKEHAMPLHTVLAKMEYGGVTIDRDRTRQYIDIITEKTKELEEKLYYNVGYKFNTSSSSGDLKRILFEEKGYTPLWYSNKTGEPSTDAETLKELYDIYNDEFLQNLTTFRKLDKCVHTYLLNWLKMSELDGKLHCNFNQINTATHRLSSSNPNLGRKFGGCKTA